MQRVFIRQTADFRVGDLSPENWSDPQWESFQRAHGPQETYSVTVEEAQKVGAETIAAQRGRRGPRP
jgi:hypothetical protein